MDPATINGLLVARGLLDRSDAARDGTVPGEITALILLDAAVESGAKALLGGKFKKGAGFQATVQALNERYNDAVGDQIPAAGRVLELRDYRNGVQHAGNVPARENMDRFAVYAKDFLEAVTKGLTNIPLWEVSRAQLITNSNIREQVDLAESALSDGKPEAVAQHAAIAFELALQQFRERQPWRRRGRLDQYRLRRALESFENSKSDSRAGRLLRDALTSIPMKRAMSSFDADRVVKAATGSGTGDSRPLLEVLQGVITEIEFLNERVEAAMVAGDAGEHAWFRARVGNVVGAGDGTFMHLAPEPPLEGKETVRALNFAIDAALRQQVLAESPAPEGSMAGLAERRSWEDFKAQIVALASEDPSGQVSIDAIVEALADPSTSRVEPALSELLEEGRLIQVAGELFESAAAESG